MKSKQKVNIQYFLSGKGLNILAIKKVQILRIMLYDTANFNEQLNDLHKLCTEAVYIPIPIFCTYLCRYEFQIFKA